MDMNVNAKSGTEAQLVASNALNIDAALKTKYHVECFRDGKKIWEENIYNLVTTEGKNYLLDVGFHAAAAVSTWYLGLIDLVGYTALAATDVAAQINLTNGWDELSEYDELNRIPFVEGAAAAGSLSNAASVAVFTISATKTVKGAFLASVLTKDAVTGILYGEALFSADRAVVDNDVIKVTLTMSL